MNQAVDTPVQTIHNAWAEMKLLAVGDMHLGRVPATLPDALADQVRTLGPEIAWQRCVQAAIEHRVEAVLLAGDVVEGSRDFFAGYAALKAGIEALLAEQIQVIAVAGNHDTEVLPRLADAVPELTLLGRGGEWQLHELSAAAVLGWSFPKARVLESPLADLPSLTSSQPVIGLLHCDLDQANSHYAPVKRTELERTDTAAWLLGHIHKPSFSNDDDANGRWIGYLGSVSALRASETGLHGPWLLKVDGTRIEARQLGLAPLAYEALEMDAGLLDDPDTLSSLVLEHARSLVNERLRQEALPDALGLRIRLVGETRFGPELEQAARTLTDRGQVWQELDCQLFIHHIHVDTQPEIDLAEHARQSDAMGLLARDLLVLEGPDCDARKRLVQQARQRLAALDDAPFSGLTTPMTADDTLAWLKQAGRAALTQMLATRE